MGQKEQIIAVDSFQSLLPACKCAECEAVLISEDKIFHYNNRMLIDDDPTAHSAVILTREQRRILRKKSSFQILLNARPCPMCVNALYQVNVRELSYLDKENKMVHLTLNSNTNCWYEEIYLKI